MDEIVAAVIAVARAKPNNISLSEWLGALDAGSDVIAAIVDPVVIAQCVSRLGVA